MNFTGALACLRDGSAVRRTGWARPNTFIVLIDREEMSITSKTALSDALGVDQVTLDAHIAMVLPGMGNDAKPLLASGWLASQADLLADDWVLLEHSDVSEA